MDMSRIGPAVSAGIDLGQNIASLFGVGGQNGWSSRDQYYQNLADMRENYMHAVEWRVDDARRAGINPLAALGYSGMSSTPQVVGDFGSNFGQDLSGAVHRASDSVQRLNGYDDKLDKLKLENAGLQNDLLRSQIAKLNSTQSPPLPTATDFYNIEGQTGSGIKVLPVRSSASAPTDQSRDYGAINDFSLVKTGHGTFAIAPSETIAPRVQNFPEDLLWSVRNRLIPYRKGLAPTPEAPYGYFWMPVVGEYAPRPKFAQDVSDWIDRHF